ncbi:hypothetical protein KEM54_005148 [Ascosphaera aggregata]|nr:hypothetical protein KEM54_005148 [Ascosphaera aggregata]
MSPLRSSEHDKTKKVSSEEEQRQSAHSRQTPALNASYPVNSEGKTPLRALADSMREAWLGPNGCLSDDDEESRKRVETLIASLLEKDAAAHETL